MLPVKHGTARKPKEKTMQPEIVVGALSLCGTLIGTIGGILASNKLTIYRIGQLEEKVNKHNSLIERMYKCEDRLNIVEHDIADIKDDVK